MANDALSIRGLIAGYGAVRALDGVSMDVGPGQTVALLGTNGNGKTTLMRCALGLVKPWEGEIRATLGSRSAILSRLEPEEIVGLGVPVSIDTMKAKVASAALEAGAAIVTFGTVR